MPPAAADQHRPRTPRLRLVATVSSLAVAASLAAAPAAHAADKTPFIVVGTSDVFDSHLVQDVIEPGFEKAYPQYDLQYVSKGTGAAIAYAEAGSASAMIVHAASLENQFVDQGYSAEKYGRALFWGDYVLLGPANDPAGVMTGGQPSHDVATAFEKIAAAGAAGTADFVSRGGTPGTTVQEHAIWKLTSGVTTCTVSDTNGGGTAPSGASGPCPATADNPSWYHTTNQTQGPNILTADACAYASQSCYVFTDRGTFNYLQSTKAITKLTLVGRDNTAKGARGGQSLLVNSFHGYAVNPAAVPTGSNVDKTAALLFLNYLTSPAAQTAVGNYLNDQADPPFLPSAAPAVTASAPAATVKAGSAITVSGSVRNVVPGTPTLAGQPVSLYGTTLTSPKTTVRVAGANTDASGNYRITYVPSVSRSYQVRTGAITQIENNGLDPVFGDLLAPATATAGTTKVLSRIVRQKVSTSTARYLVVTGRVAPGGVGVSPHVSLYATTSKTAMPVYRAKLVLKPGQQAWTAKFRLAKGTYRYYLGYVGDASFVASKTAIYTATVR